MFFLYGMVIISFIQSRTHANVSASRTDQTSTIFLVATVLTWALASLYQVLSDARSRGKEKDGAVAAKEVMPRIGSLDIACHFQRPCYRRFGLLIYLARENRSSCTIQAQGCWCLKPCLMGTAICLSRELGEISVFGVFGLVAKPVASSESALV